MVLRLGKEKDDKRRKIKQEKFFDSDIVNWGKKIKHRQKRTSVKLMKIKKLFEYYKNVTWIEPGFECDRLSFYCYTQFI
jgi:hypothetical protein